ncbi:hypothetical protein [Burkholderia anthina]
MTDDDGELLWQAHYKVWGNQCRRSGSRGRSRG